MSDSCMTCGDMKCRRRRNIADLDNGKCTFWQESECLWICDEEPL